MYMQARRSKAKEARQRKGSTANQSEPKSTCAGKLAHVKQGATTAVFFLYVCVHLQEEPACRRGARSRLNTGDYHRIFFNLIVYLQEEPVLCLRKLSKSM